MDGRFGCPAGHGFVLEPVAGGGRALLYRKGIDLHRYLHIIDLMGNFSKIQWTDTTCNGTTGCATGCELYNVSLEQQLRAIDQAILDELPDSRWEAGTAKNLAKKVFAEQRARMVRIVTSLDEGITDSNVCDLLEPLKSEVKPLYRGVSGASKAIDNIKSIEANTVDEFCQRLHRALPNAPCRPSVADLKRLLEQALPGARERGAHAVAEITKLSAHQLAVLKKEVRTAIADEYGKKEASIFQRVLGKNTACYASLLTRNRGLSVLNPLKYLNKGQAEEFERIRKRPGETMKAARQKDLINTTNPATPWKRGLPRMIFFSDMGDSAGDPRLFDFLESDCLAAMTSDAGKRHIWQWLTKQPQTLDRFADKVGGLPPNVMAMTTLTCVDEKNLARLERIKKVRAHMYGLSLEPIRSRIPPEQLDLTGIDWVILGGESGGGSHVPPFHIEWALELIEHCRQQGVAVFLKQMGAKPHYKSEPIALKDEHGGDWEEWLTHPALQGLDLKVREFPKKYYDYRPICQPFADTRPAGKKGGKQEVDARRVLTPEQAERFADLNKTVRQGLKGMIDAAIALEEIRRDRLYREKYDTFESYCNEVHQMSRQYASRLIGAAKIYHGLSTIVDKIEGAESVPLPRNELQLSALKPLPEPELRLQAYTAALDAVEGYPERVTAELIRAKVQEIMPERAPPVPRPPPAVRLEQVRQLVQGMRDRVRDGGDLSELLDELEAVLGAE